MKLNELSPRRKADRNAIAALIVETVEREGGTAAIRPAPLNPRDLWVHIKADDAHVTITVGPSEADGYLTPWNVQSDSEKRFSGAFGAACRASVNPYHRRKCMGYARTLRDLLTELSDALICIAMGDAFEV